MADDPKEPEETEEAGGEDVEAEANVEFKPLIDVRLTLLCSCKIFENGDNAITSV